MMTGGRLNEGNSCLRDRQSGPVDSIALRGRHTTTNALLGQTGADERRPLALSLCLERRLEQIERLSPQAQAAARPGDA